MLLVMQTDARSVSTSPRGNTAAAGASIDPSFGRRARPPGTLRPVEHRDIRDLVRFSEEGPRHGTLFESEHLWSEVVCLDRTQEMGPILDRDSDAIFVVVAGEAAIQVGKARRRLQQWSSVLVPAGSEITVRNASVEPAVLLIVAAPPPTPRMVSE
jgi:mannose-6-phosphate isomerase-like protein (cupin superfamily)